MEKLSTFFKKIDKDLLVGALCLVAATLLFVNPGAVLHTIIKVVGAVILAAAVLRFIFAIKNGHFMPFAALNAALLFTLGLIMLVTPGSTLKFIFSAIGIYLLINALLHIFKLVAIPRPARGLFWWTDVLFTAIVFILGIWLLLSPSDAGRLTEIIAGVSLTVKGVELLCNAFDSHRKSGGKKQGGSSDIEADYVDKSHEL